ncbi:efflux RND transporter periplasmic adaptor subunit [Ningiella sp. W23]|uniref:efflux RND transporter periplasmic adaptor subunit n=1 Tax=Ningiella sp. W23 TaxID=3023715 RepID=UPI0037567B82
MNKYVSKNLLTGLILGIVLSACVYFFAISIKQNTSADEDTADEPLYWVAPMDPNFKRDTPGKSPMGMDLVPVYADDASQDSPGTVSIDPVTIQNLGVKTIILEKLIRSDTIESFATVRFAEDKVVHVHPRVQGWIETLHARTQGEYVEKGAPLYSLYSPELVNAQEELLLALQQNNRALIRAAEARLIALNAPNSLIESLSKNREVARSVTFYASQSGFISEINIQEGFFVKPSTTMLAIASLDTVWLIADVLSSDLSKVALGQSASIEFDHLPSKSYLSQIEYIYPQLNEYTRTAQARFVLSNADLSLKPKMFATVQINTSPEDKAQTNPVLMLPEQALIRTGKQERVVLALGEGKFKSVEVKVGAKFDQGYEVVEGLSEGDEVVVSAQFLIDSESSITSNFMRMQDHFTTKNEVESLSAWTEASVEEVMADMRMLRLTHGPLDAFNMMGMTMNFELADNIDITSFEVSMQVHVEIVQAPSGMYQVKTVHFVDGEHQ